MAVGTGFNDDFNKGVMDRFRTMPIARSSVLIAKIVVELGADAGRHRRSCWSWASLVGFDITRLAGSVRRRGAVRWCSARR